MVKDENLAKEIHFIQFAAGAIAAQERLRLSCGVLIAVPIPEEAEAEAEPVQRAIEKALDEAEQSGISGPAATPFLLKRVNELTGGSSLKVVPSAPQQKEIDKRRSAGHWRNTLPRNFNSSVPLAASSSRWSPIRT